MAEKSGSLNYWRGFFRSTEADIFEVIEQAILVAAVDCPKEFRSRRDRIAEKLFSCRVSKCYGCNNVELMVPDAGEDLRVEEGGASVKWELVEKDSKIGSCNGDHDELAKARLTNYSYDEAEALTEMMDEENRIIEEVLRLKEVLRHSHDQSEGVLFDSLRRLQLMQLSVETLKATGIGRIVNDLRRHNFKQIGRIARTLIEGWKESVDEWVQSAAAIAENGVESVKPEEFGEDDGLLSPPMDEGALFATQSTSFQLSEIFDGLDEDGNFRVPADTLKPVPESRGPVRRPETLKQPVVAQPARPLSVPVAPPKPQTAVAPPKPQTAVALPKPQTAVALPKPQTAASNFAKPSTSASGPSRLPQRPTYAPKPNGQVSAVQRMPPIIPLAKSKEEGEDAYKSKLELAKRKLHEGYEQAENAKRQRTIQLVEFQELPKPSNSQRGKPNTQRGKPKIQGRNWANPRR